jgi:hypothetical protein
MCISILPPYLDKIIANHGCSEEGKNETRLIEPLHPSSIKELETSEGHEDTTEVGDLEKAAGFGYRNGIGEIMFTYVTCRLDIGYAIPNSRIFPTIRLYAITLP